jgi:hypothetical protein
MSRGFNLYDGICIAFKLQRVTKNRDLDLGDLDHDLEKFSRSRDTHWSKYHVCIMYGYRDTWVCVFGGPVSFTLN